MSLGRNPAEQELTALLSRTLVQKEVMEPMNKIGWTASAPPPPDYTTTPASGQPAPGGSTTAGGTAPAAPAPGQPGAAQPGAPAEPAKADTAPLDLVALFESLRDETGLIGGKYKTVEEAIKGGKHLAQMANKAFGERDEMAKKLASATQDAANIRQTPMNMAPVATPVPAVSRQQLEQAQANYDKVLSEIGEDGGVLDAEAGKKLAKAGRELAAAEADYRVQERLASRDSAQDAENRKWDEVEAYMHRTHPDAERFSDEVALYVRSNTPLAKAVDALRKAGDFVGATEIAWVTFRDATGTQALAEKTAADQTREIQLEERKGVREAAREEALKDAGIVKGSAGGSGVHQGGTQRGSLDERNALISRMRVEGDGPGSPGARAFREMVIPLPPGLFPN